MTLTLTSEITSNGSINCTLKTDGSETHENPVICFSLMVPPRVVSGGNLIEFLGGFGAVRLDGTLDTSTEVNFELAHQADFKVANRAWLPQGCYLQHPDGTTTQIETKSGGVFPTDTEAKEPDGLGLVPAPTKWLPADGQLEVTDLAWPENNAARQEAATINRLATRCNLPPLFSESGSELALISSPGDTNTYSLQITPLGLNLGYFNTTSLFYGLISLLVLRAVHSGKIPCGKITDTPRFDWRGQHLDCARHFYQIGSIEKLLDVMALLKMNRFHWHFADDEAFRLEVECYPDLWTKSAYRGKGQTLPGLFGGGSGPTGGSYTKSQAAKLITYAKERQIEILPEIEIPAHALVSTKLFPTLRDPDDTGREQSVQGYHRNTVNPALPQTWEFLEPLAKEVADLFPFGHLHIGGDELPPDTWAGSPAVSKLKSDMDLQDHVDVQGYTMKRMAKILREDGTVPCAWEEAALGCQGGIGNDAILFSWTDQGPGLDAARRGYRVVMCPAQHTYFDMARTSGTDDWGANWAATFGLEETVNWDPVPKKEPELAKNIIGVEGAFWGEFTTEDRQMEPMIAPRILGLACMGWSQRDAVSAERLRELALGFQAIFNAVGWETNGIELR